MSPKKRTYQEFKSGLPDMVKFQSRYCCWCKYVIENQSHFKYAHCINPKCGKELPLVSNLDHSKELWWLKCLLCFSNNRCDFIYCEMCGTSLDKSKEKARAKRADQHKQRCLLQLHEKKAKEQQEKLNAEIAEKERLKKELDILKLTYASVLGDKDPATLDSEDDILNDVDMNNNAS